MEAINQKLNYKWEESAYNFVWDLEASDEHGNSVLDYSKCAKHNLLSSGRMFCKTGCFQGQEKYFEFFNFTEDKTLQIFLKMVHPIQEQKMCGEKFEITSATVRSSISIGRSSLRKYYQHNNGSFVPSNKPHGLTDPEDASKWTITWMKATFPDNSLLPISKVNCLKFDIKVQRRREKCVSSSTPRRSQPDVEFTIDTSKNLTDQLCSTPFLFSSNFSDVTVYCIDKQYPAHKLILASKSSVLAAILSHSMQDKVNGELNIEDASPEIVEEFLRFIYTGSVKNLEQNAAGLSLIAEKYDLPGLKVMSTNYLVRTISIENVLERYSLGKLLNSEELVKNCITQMKTDKRRIWKTVKDFFEVCQEHPELFDVLFV